MLGRVRAREVSDAVEPKQVKAKCGHTSYVLDFEKEGAHVVRSLVELREHAEGEWLGQQNVLYGRER
jgi:hypothetical protein